MFASRVLDKVETCLSFSDRGHKKILVGDDVIYCVGFSLLFSILLARSGPTLIK